MSEYIWQRNNVLRQSDSCHVVHDPSYQSPGFCSSALPIGFCSSLIFKKLWNRAVKTAATSFASNCGISVVSGSAFWPVFSLYECNRATQGRTTSSFRARLAGNSHRCSTQNGAGKGSFMFGRPISSVASRRAVSNAVSSSVSAFPIDLGQRIRRRKIISADLT